MIAIEPLSQYPGSGDGAFPLDLLCLLLDEQSSKDRLVAEAITAHGYSEMEVASFLRLRYSTISRILTVDKRANVKTLALRY